MGDSEFARSCMRRYSALRRVLNSEDRERVGQSSVTTTSPRLHEERGAAAVVRSWRIEARPALSRSAASGFLRLDGALRCASGLEVCGKGDDTARGAASSVCTPAVFSQSSLVCTSTLAFRAGSLTISSPPTLSTVNFFLPSSGKCEIYWYNSSFHGLPSTGEPLLSRTRPGRDVLFSSLLCIALSISWIRLRKSRSTSADDERSLTGEREVRSLGERRGRRERRETAKDGVLRFVGLCIIMLVTLCTRCLVKCMLHHLHELVEIDLSVT